MYLTPYTLMYGVEAVLSLDIQIPLLRITILEGLSEDENHELWLAELTQIVDGEGV